MDADESLLKEFLTEVKENLETLDQSLVALEQNPGNREIIDSIFRSLHSTKGAAGFFGFSQLESVAHSGENLLNSIREGNVAIDTRTTSALLQALDALRAIATGIEASGAEQPSDYSALTATMAALMAAAPPAAPPLAAPAPAPAPPAPPTGSPPTFVDADDALEETIPPEPASPARGAVAVGVVKEDKKPRAEEGIESIRVDVELLDELMDLVGELVLSRNQILQVTQSAGAPSGDLTQSSQQLDRITTELQERVMKTRMQPIKQVWAKFPRITRDLSVQLGKRIRLEMEGEGTELDRTLIEAIKDPLTHLVRNAVDHGIEAPDARVAAGKPAEGRFVLRAFHESGQVIIEIEDDGAGIHVERVKRKAVEKGLITEEQAAAMPPKEAMRLIFRPGLSTAEKITNVSGRGVGMDVVRANIERIGGSIEVESRQGEGTKFRIKIPLTLAIIPALLVNTDAARFAIPQVNVLELIRLKDEEIQRSIEAIHGTIATRLRGQILPLLDLKELLAGRTGVASAELRRRGERAVNIVVLQASKRKFGLLVDGVEESQEIVVKPMSRQLQDIPVYAGATILGDGSIALILDTPGVAQYGGVLGENEELDELDEANAEAAAAKDSQSLLIIQTEGDGRLAIPLASVARLEKFPVAKVESTGGQDVIQYREDIMRLVRLSDVLPGARPAPSTSDVLEVVVFQHEGLHVGLVVERILDIVETSVPKLKPAGRRNVLGSAIIKERVTEFLDVPATIRTAHALSHMEVQHA